MLDLIELEVIIFLFYHDIVFNNLKSKYLKFLVLNAKFSTNIVFTSWC